MHEDQDADWASIERVLAGDASGEEQLEVREWAERDPANAELFAQLEAAWRAAAASDHRYDSHAAWTRVSAQLHDGASPGTTRPRSGARRSALRWAAVVALLAGGGAIMWQQRPAATADVPLMAARVSTGTGQRATVRLGDGTTVTLGPQSAIREADEDGAERRIELTGVAHFDVLRDERHPFVVMVGAAETRVLGTSFSIRGYGGESPLEVMVESGRVSVRPDARHEPVELNTGQVATVTADGSVHVRSGVDVVQRLSWREGRLSFDGEPLHLVAAELERWYGIDVSIADTSIATFPLTATFAGADIADVLTVTSRSLGIRHSFDGQTAEFRR